MELRFLDAERRQEGARYISDERLEPRDSVILARAIRERQRRDAVAAGFSEAAGDCMAFKYLRDAEETRSRDERLAFVGAVTAAADAAAACHEPVARRVLHCAHVAHV
jgi:Rubisco accumulation factor 1 alpha helical domain